MSFLCLGDLKKEKPGRNKVGGEGIKPIGG